MNLRQHIEDTLWTASEADIISRYQGRCHIRFLGPGQPVTDSIHSLTQIHSTDVVKASVGTRQECEGDRIKADGLFTRTPGDSLCIKTADCLPIILWCEEQNFLAALHAGWRGLFGDILGRAIKIHAELGGQAGSLHMITGPCISMAHFEVGPELLQSLNATGIAESEQYLALEKGVSDRWHIDLAMVAVLQGVRYGLNGRNMSVLRSCTYALSDRWNSYRRTGLGSPSNLTIASLFS